MSIFVTAESLRADLAALPSVQQVYIAGSIRRGKRDPKDIELVALVQPVTDIFGQAEDAPTMDATDLLLAQGQKLKGGRSYTQLVIDGHKVDYFQTWDAQRFGLLLFIRTGSADYVHRALIHWKSLTHGGYSSSNLLHDAAGTPRPTPTEAAVYAALEWPWAAPEDRR